jgi:hypothetical protein
VQVYGAHVRRPPYGASRSLALPHFFVSEEIGLQTHMGRGKGSFRGSGVDFVCPEFLGMEFLGGIGARP